VAARARLEELASGMGAEWAASFVGQCERVLFEEQDADGRLWGYTDRYVRLSATGAEELLGMVQYVRLTASSCRKGICLLKDDGLRGNNR